MIRAVGICRFSFPALGGFQTLHDTVEERETYLYAPERIENRFRHFEALTLPSISAQTDPRFTLLIVIGKSLPQQHKDRLHDLTTQIPQIKIVESDPMRHRIAMQRVIQTELRGHDDLSLQFRLDDDDAVGINFIHSIRRTTRLATKLHRNWNNMVLEYSSGYTVRLTQDGILAQKAETPFLSCGMAVLFRPDSSKTVMNYGHHKLHHTMPTLIDPQMDMYLRAVHDNNDSKANQKAKSLAPLDEAGQILFKERFNVDNEQVKSLFTGPLFTGSQPPHDRA